MPTGSTIPAISRAHRGGDELVVEHNVGAKTKREVVDLALRELIARKEQRKLKGLRGRALIDPNYDVRRVRRNMQRGAR